MGDFLNSLVELLHVKLKFALQLSILKIGFLIKVEYLVHETILLKQSRIIVGSILHHCDSPELVAFVVLLLEVLRALRDNSWKVHFLLMFSLCFGNFAAYYFVTLFFVLDVLIHRLNVDESSLPPVVVVKVIVVYQEVWVDLLEVLDLLIVDNHKQCRHDL